MQFDATKALIAYAGITTAALAAIALGAAAAPPRNATFGTIDVQRINVREPDGTLRAVLSDKTLAPGIVVRGKEYPHPDRKTAGMIFYNDEGSENGGLSYGGSAAYGGSSYGGLTFDRYEQDQIIQMSAEEKDGRRRSGFSVYDRPEGRFDYPAIAAATKLPPAQRDAAMRAANAGGSSRLFVGRAEDRSSQVALRDSAGRPRLVLSVQADGAARIAFLDAAGRITKTIDPARP